MYLDSTLRKMQVVLGAAKATLDCPVLVDYVDITATTTTPGLYPSLTNGTTAVDMLPAPAASTQRKVNGVSIHNKDTASINVQINLLDNATSYQIIDLVLPIGDTLGYTDTQGWYTVSPVENLTSIVPSIVSSIGGTANAITGSPNPFRDPLSTNEAYSFLVAATNTEAVTLDLGTSDGAVPIRYRGAELPAGTIRAGDVAIVTFNGAYFVLTNIAAQTGYPSIASHATTMDIFSAAGVTVGVSGTATVTAIPNCISTQIGVPRTIIPSDAAGFSITATANIVVDGATSGTYLMPFDANIQIIATSVSTFKITTMTGIVSSGSNANGSYIQFSDGTMICRHRITSAGNITTANGALFFAIIGWVFPVAFVGAPMVSGVGDGAGAIYWITSYGATTNTSSPLALHAATSIAATGTAQLTAIGKWK